MEGDADPEAAFAFAADRGVMHVTSRANPAEWDHGRVRGRMSKSVQRVHGYGRHQGVEVAAETLP